MKRGIFGSKKRVRSRCSSALRSCTVTSCRHCRSAPLSVIVVVAASRHGSRALLTLRERKGSVRLPTSLNQSCCFGGPALDSLCLSVSVSQLDGQTGQLLPACLPLFGPSITPPARPPARRLPISLSLSLSLSLFSFSSHRPPALHVLLFPSSFHFIASPVPSRHSFHRHCTNSTHQKRYNQATLISSPTFATADQRQATEGHHVVYTWATAPFASVLQAADLALFASRLYYITQRIHLASNKSDNTRIQYGGLTRAHQLHQ